jgi:predicted permease
MESLFQDLRYSVRTLRSAPLFTAVAVLTLAFGAGANTVVFSILNTLYFRTAPVRSPNELVTSLSYDRGISFPEYRYTRDHNASFSGLAAEYSTAHAYLENGDNSRIVLGAIVSANYFELLGIKPFLGRFFLAQEEAQAGESHFVILSYALWKNTFGADRQIVGKAVKLNRESVTIIGVAPPEFHRLFFGSDNDLWTTSQAASFIVPHCDPLKVECGFFSGFIGRLKPGTQLASAEAELNGLSRQWEALYPELKKSTTKVYRARGIEPASRREVSQLPPLLVAAIALLLIIVCANLCGLLLARGVARSREISIRLALGAGRARIVRQLLTEAAILGFLGTCCGFFLLFWSQEWLSHFPFASEEGFASYYDVQLDWRVLAATFAAGVLTVLIFGLAPAFRVSKLMPMQAITQRDSVTRRSRLGGILVASQVALAVILAAAAVLVFESLDHILMGRGFDPSHVAVVRVSPYRLGYAPDRSAKIQNEALRRLANLPGVESVSFGQLMPWWETWEDWIALAGQNSPKQALRINVHYNSIAPGYLKTLKIPLLRGREFTEQDRKDTPNVVIVNQTLARELWPNQEALGQTLLMGGVRSWEQHTGNTEEATVVGVAADAQYNPARDAVHTFMYLPYWQIQNNGDSRFMVRTAGDPALALREIKSVIRKIDPDVPVGEDSTMVQALLSDFGPLRLARVVLMFAGLAALALSALGLYSILAFLVTQRTREIGIRLALGATREQVLRLFLREGMSLAVAGSIAGLAAALLSLRMLRALLYGTTPADPAVLLAVLLLLGATCALASYLPARRATKVDPIVALRYE